MRPDRAPPQNLAQLIDNLQASYSGKAVVIGLHTPLQGVKLQGHVVNDLPPSVMDSLRAGTSAQQETVMNTVLRKPFAEDHMIEIDDDLAEIEYYRLDGNGRWIVSGRH